MHLSSLSIALSSANASESPAAVLDGAADAAFLAAAPPVTIDCCTTLHPHSTISPSVKCGRRLPISCGRKPKRHAIKCIDIRMITSQNATVRVAWVYEIRLSQRLRSRDTLRTRRILMSRSIFSMRGTRTVALFHGDARGVSEQFVLCATRRRHGVGVPHL